MATYTTNLGLKKPDYEDAADIMDLNDNADRIDAAYGEQQNAITDLQNRAYGSFGINLWDCTRFPDMKTFFASAVFTTTPTGSTQQGNMFYSDLISIGLPIKCVPSSVAVSGSAENLHLIANPTVTENTLSFRLVRGTAIQTTSPIKVTLLVAGRYTDLI